MQDLFWSEALWFLQKKKLGINTAQASFSLSSTMRCSIFSVSTMIWMHQSVPNRTILGPPLFVGP